jgi:hypothetical protein
MILYGGFLNKHQFVNILLRSSKLWTKGFLRINNKQINTLDPNKNNFIEFEPQKCIGYNLYQQQPPTLLLNNTIIYQQPQLFNYQIELSLDLSLSNFSYKDLHDTIELFQQDKNYYYNINR